MSECGNSLSYLIANIEREAMKKNAAALRRECAAAKVMIQSRCQSIFMINPHRKMEVVPSWG